MKGKPSSLENGTDSDCNNTFENINIHKAIPFHYRYNYAEKK